MKKIVSLLLVLALVLGMAPAALAADDATKIKPNEKRNIKVKKVGLNEVEEGISPTTGLPLSDLELPEGFQGLAVTGRYLPMLVQIDNTNGGVDAIAPWGASYADIVYESPLHKKGMTRMSFLFSDLIPDSVGPVRSARLGHVHLREEWDAGFLYYGAQEYAKTNVPKEFARLGANKKGVLFSGTVGSGKPWKQYYSRRKGVPSPHNVNANVAAMYGLIPEDHVAPNHTFLFTDVIPEGEAAEEIIIKTGMKGYGSNLIYDWDSNMYYRYMRQDDDELVPYEDRDTQEQLAFANVIIQFTDVTWVRSDAPKTVHVGKGNADFFMGGVHIKGCWQRKEMEDRTVFYDSEGNEIALQRGKTLIVIVDSDLWEVSYK